ncbi:MAG: PTS sugar transporter subunit IIC, partial [Clostridia bacterium]|nr:PTS sugar transporter subunit IIC [Clostridia bacterium]
MGNTVRKYLKKYFIDAMGAMAQGLFASLLIGTIQNTLGTQLNWTWLADAGKFAQSMAGPAMAIAIGFSLKTSPYVIFSLAAVGAAANSLGGAGGPLAVYVIAIIAAELGQLVS